MDVRLYCDRFSSVFTIVTVCSSVIKLTKTCDLCYKEIGYKGFPVRAMFCNGKDVDYSCIFVTFSYLNITFLREN